MPTQPQPAAGSTGLRGCVDVLCDGAGRVGALSYRVPDGMVVRPGDAVRVPFGRRVVYGMVLGAGDPAAATRDVEEVFGKRATEADITVARALADRHFVEFAAVFPRLAPRSGRGAPPLQAGPVVLTDAGSDPAARYLERVPPEVARRLLLRAPLVDPARLAALEAARLASAAPDPDAGIAQVLVLCPTVELVRDVVAQFSSGAARLDTKAKPGAWKGFTEGTVAVGVGTRSAALYSARRLAGIVVVEEDHPGHVEATQPHWHARDVAVARTLAGDVPLVLTSANPSPAGVGAKVKVLPVGGRSEWPAVRLVNRDEFPPGDRLVPPPLAAALARENAAGRRPLVLAQRRRAVRRCARCGDQWECTLCESSSCRHPESRPCRRCGVAAGVRMAGWDAERLADLFGSRARVVTAAELAAERDAGLVVLFDVDAALSAAGLVPDQLAAHLVMVAAQAAGPGGTLLALTSDPAQPLLADLLVRRDARAVARRAWEAARAAGLPPFGRLVTARCGQPTKPRTTGWPGTVYGPRRAGDEWEVLVRVSEPELGKLKPYIDRLRRGGKTRVTVS